MARTCLLVLGGDIRDDSLFRQRLTEADRVLVADSGARHLVRLGKAPDVVYGDFDSLTPEELRLLEEGGCRFVRSPAEKNDTDGGIVLREALKQGFRDIRIWGALGGRPDHSFANITLLQFVFLPECRELGIREEEDLPDIVIEDKGYSIFLAKKKQWIEGRKGDFVSFFALSSEVSGFKQQGLKYQPAGDRYVSAFPLGVSNELTRERAWIDWREGVLLCMHIHSS
ncbi:MAG: thiamine diphosphokinase [Clostridiales bacterium]|nr:thiamine diphosphokinase [Clostridiales bacterium]